MEETGKTGITVLERPAGAELLATLSAGDRLVLQQQEGALQVTTPDGTYVGTIEDRLSARLVRLMQSGNEYQAGVVGVDDNAVRVIIRETRQSPQNAGRISFPPRTSSESLPRPYLREGLMRRGGDEEDEDELDIDADVDVDEDDDDASEFGFHEGTLDEG
jgi:hypothetical protein